MAAIARILIVGAGMAGVSLAIALRRAGLKPQLVERQPGWPTHGAGIYLVGNAMRALKAWGLADEVMRRGAPIRKQVLLDHRGRRLNEIDTESVWGACGPCVGLRRADLQRVLVDALGEPAPRFSTTVSAIEDRGAEVRVRFSDGSEGAFDLLVGADGVQSSVRKLVFPEAKPRFCGQVAWRFTVSGPPQITGWTLFSGKRGVFLFIPVGGGQAYCYADAAVPEPFDDPLEGRLERLRARFAEYAGPVPEALAELRSPEQVHFGAIEDILQQPWAKGRVLLIGDAAHAASPNMASGAAMAFEDSLVLAELAASGRSVEQAIAEYTSRRAPRVRWVHEQTRKRDAIRRLPPLIRDWLTRRLAERVYRANYAPLVERF